MLLRLPQAALLIFPFLPDDLVKVYVENVRDDSEEYGDVYYYRDSWIKRMGLWRNNTNLPCVACQTICKGISAPDVRDVFGCTGVKTSHAAQSSTEHIIQRLPRARRAPFRWSPTCTKSVWCHPERMPIFTHPTHATSECTSILGQVPTTPPTSINKHLVTVNLSQPGAVADFYVDDELRATQVPSADLWVDAYTLQKIEARNVSSDGGATPWRDARTWVNFPPGQTRSMTFYLLPPPPGTVPTTPPPPTAEAPADDVAPPAADIPVPDAPPAANYTGTFSNIPGAALTIYQRGQQLGNRANAFSKVGDSETSERQFLVPIDENLFDLGQYGYLIGTVNHFRGSFGRTSLAAKPGFPVHSIVNPIWADPAFCNPGETSLECEYRVHKPAFALIMVRTWNIDMYYTDLVKVVETSINMGVVPILSTVPEAEPPPWASTAAHNAIIRQVAAEYQVPLWDLWQTTETLGHHGVCESCGDHLTLPPDFRVTHFVSPYIDFGATHRNLEALEVLHAMISQIILGG